jgi:branched-chain amino acid transport system substrate-binding protein
VTFLRTAQALLALLILATVPGRAADEPYEVYAIVSLTGPAAFLGRGVALTLGALERSTNNTGGIKGRPLKFVIQDDQSSPANAVAIANQIIAKRVPVIVGPIFSATCSAVVPLVTNGPVMYCLSNAIHPPAGSFAFSAMPSSKDFASVAFRYLKAKGVRKIAFLGSTDATGQDGEQVALENLRSPEFRDLQIVATEHFAVNDLTVTAQISRIKASGAEALDAWTTGPAFGTILRGLAEQGWSGYVMTHAGNMSKAQMDQYAQILPGQLFLAGPPMYATSDLPSVRVARTTYLDSLHQANVGDPDLTHFVAWDPTMLVIQALRAIGPTATATQVRDYLGKLHGFSGVNGRYDFRRGDQRGIDPMASVLVRWDKPTHEFIPISKPGGMPL